GSDQVLAQVGVHAIHARGCVDTRGQEVEGDVRGPVLLRPAGEHQRKLERPAMADVEVWQPAPEQPDRDTICVRQQAHEQLEAPPAPESHRAPVSRVERIAEGETALPRLEYKADGLIGLELIADAMGE